MGSPTRRLPWPSRPEMMVVETWRVAGWQDGDEGGHARVKKTQ